MRIETLLPLGKVDPGLRAPETPLDLRTVAADAALVESVGYDGLVVEETKDDPFVVLALAATTTTTLGLGTSVAIAFPAQPDDHRPERMVAAEAERRAVHTRARVTGPRTHRAPLRHGLVAACAVDARLHRCRARRVGLLAEPHATRLPQRRYT
jgi:hypothetical protein